jgi:hypothetical protein
MRRTISWAVFALLVSSGDVFAQRHIALRPRVIVIQVHRFHPRYFFPYAVPVPFFYPGPYYTQYYSFENFVPASTAVVRRVCFERCGGFDVALRTGEDYEMWLRLSAHFEFDFIPESTMRYRTGGWQMSTDYRGRYETAIGVMQRFLEQNPGAVDRLVVRSAWAHTYTGRGNVTLWRAQDRVGALRDYLRALSFRPGYWPAWRAILRSFVTARAPSS